MHIYKICTYVDRHKYIHTNHMIMSENDTAFYSIIVGHRKTYMFVYILCYIILYHNFVSDHIIYYGGITSM